VRRYCEEPEGRQSNPETVFAALDCFAEPVIGPRDFARVRWLAMTVLVPEVPRAGQHHGDAVVVGGFDHLVVAH
jgi:hypothetical protein